MLSTLSGRSRRTSVVPVGALTLLVGAAAPVTAASLAFDDPRGDAYGGLDVTHVKVGNNDHGVVVLVQVEEVRTGSVVVSLDRRKGLGRTVVTQRRADGKVSAFVLRGSFADRFTGERVRCSRLAATWDAQADTVRLRMPSVCLDRGDYGALRSVVLAEDPGGSDSDLAPAGPEDDFVWTGWVPRG